MKKFKIDKSSSVPKVRQIEQQIRDKIESGELKTDQKLPGMQDLANQMEVSIGLIRLALRTLTLEGFLRSVPKVGVFVSQKRPTRDIALVLPSVELEQASRIVRSARLALSNNFRLIIEAATNDFDSQIGLLEHIQNSRIEGILLMTPPLQQYAAQLNELLRESAPCVQLLFALKGIPTDSCTFDGIETGKLAVEYLIKKGHTEIGLVDTDADAFPFKDRKTGMDQALQKIGKNYKELPREIIKTDLNTDDPFLRGKQATARLLKKHPEITAIIGGNGNVSMGSILAIKEAGKSIPEDISLIAMGMDLSPFEHMTPAITAIDEPLEKICQRATQILIDHINNPEEVFHSIQFSPVLYERQSVKDLSS